MFCFGVCWQICLNYIPLTPRYMNYDWSRVNYLSCLFIMPIMYLLTQKFDIIICKSYFLSRIGKGSYNIYLVQMVFYGCGYSDLLYSRVGNFTFSLFINIFLCCSIGYLFFVFENRITSFLIKYFYLKVSKLENLFLILIRKVNKISFEKIADE